MDIPDEFYKQLFTHQIDITDEGEREVLGNNDLITYKPIYSQFNTMNTYFNYLDVPVDDRDNYLFEVLGTPEQNINTFFNAPDNQYKTTFDLFSEKISYQKWKEGLRADKNYVEEKAGDIQNNAFYIANFTGWSRPQRLLQALHTLYALSQGKILDKPVSQLTIIDLIGRNLTPEQVAQCELILQQEDFRYDNILNNQELLNATITYCKIFSDYVKQPIHPVVEEKLREHISEEAFDNLLNQVKISAGSLSIKRVHGIKSRNPEVQYQLGDLYRIKFTRALQMYEIKDDHFKELGFVFTDQDENNLRNPELSIDTAHKLKIDSIFPNHNLEPNKSLFNFKLRNIDPLNYYCYYAFAELYNNLKSPEEPEALQNAIDSEYVFTQEDMPLDFQLISISNYRLFSKFQYGKLISYVYSTLNHNNNNVLTQAEYQERLPELQALWEQRIQQMQQQMPQLWQPQPQPQQFPQGVAFEIHSAFQNINRNLYRSLLRGFTPDGVLDDIPLYRFSNEIHQGVEIPQYNFKMRLISYLFYMVYEKYTGINKTKDELFDDVRLLFNERLYLSELHPNDFALITLTFAFLIHFGNEDLLNLYLETWTKESIFAYDDPPHMSCAAGVKERFITVFLDSVNNVCCIENCDDPTLKQICVFRLLNTITSNNDKLNEYTQQWTALEDDYENMTVAQRKQSLVDFIAGKFSEGVDNEALRQEIKARVVQRLGQEPFTTYNFKCGDKMDAVIDPDDCDEEYPQEGAGKNRRGGRRRTRKGKKHVKKLKHTRKHGSKHVGGKKTRKHGKHGKHTKPKRTRKQTNKHSKRVIKQRRTRKRGKRIGGKKSRKH